MSTIKTTYIGNLQTSIEHVQSKRIVTTDADAREQKNSFSSNELFIGAVSACIITVMEATAQKNNFKVGNYEVLAERTMREVPKSIAEIKIAIEIKEVRLSDEQKKLLKDAAYNCPVVLSLNDNIRKIITISYT